ncbi:MAG TPA: hypothetical protein VLZ75_02560 [Chitinophagales bacterium]|nr:hypothetical protein [Chitinophagales bacterium]
MLGIKENLKKNDFWLIFMMVAFTFWLYFPSLSYEFIHSLDDDWYIKDNAFIKDFSLRGVYNLFFVDTTDLHYHPVTFLSLMIDYQLFGLNPMGYKLHNLLLHIACGVVIYLLLIKLSKNRFLSFFTAVVFLVHPLNMESVIWASCRRQSLSHLFFLTSVYFILISFYNVNKKRLYFIISLFLMILSILSKASAIILPFILLLIYFVVNKRITKEFFIKFLFLISLSIVFIVLNENANERNYLKREFDYTYFEHLIFAGYSYFFYWFKSIFMFPIGVFYPAPSESLEILPIQYYGFFIGSFAMVSLMIYHFIRKQYLHFFALMYFTLTIGPFLNLIFFPLGDLPMLVSNRYFYQSSMGILLYFGLLINSVFKFNNSLKYVSLVVVVLFCSLFFRYQMPIWKDSISLMKNTVQYFPSEDFYYRLAIEYYESNQLNKAVEAINKGDELGTNIWINHDWYFYCKRALVYNLSGNYSKARSDIDLAILKADGEKRILSAINKYSNQIENENLVLEN